MQKNCLWKYQLTWGTVNPKCALLLLSCMSEIPAWTYLSVRQSDINQCVHAGVDPEEFHRGSKIILQGPMFPLGGGGGSDKFLVKVFFKKKIKLKLPGKIRTPPWPPPPCGIFCEQFAKWGIAENRIWQLNAEYMHWRIANKNIFPIFQWTSIASRAPEFCHVDCISEDVLSCHDNLLVIYLRLAKRVNESCMSPNVDPCPMVRPVIDYIDLVQAL